MPAPKDKDEFTPIPPNPKADMKPDYQTVEGLQRHPLWQHLTAKQKNFILAYIETGGDRLKSVQKSHAPANAANADNMAYRLLKIAPIRRLLCIYFGYELAGAPLTRSEFKALLAERLRSPKTESLAWVKMTHILFAMTNWTLSKNAPKLGTKTERQDINDTLNEMVQKMEEQGE